MKNKFCFVIITFVLIFSNIAFAQPLNNVQEQSFLNVFSNIITHPWMSLLLLVVGTIGVITEVFVPGVGLPGIIGIISFGLFFIGNMLAGVVQFWVIGLFIIGLMLIFAELFIPGFGVFGISGLISIILSIIFAFSGGGPSFLSLVYAIIISIVLIFALIKVFKNSENIDKIILKERQNKSDGYTISKHMMTQLLGKEGIALTPLRPTGAGEFDGQKYDVITEGEFIPKESKILIHKVEGNKIFVKLKKGD